MQFNNISLGIPALVSPVGANAKIVDSSVNGCVYKDETDCEQRIEQLLLDEKLCTKMGAVAREMIKGEYSAAPAWPLFKSLFE